MCSWSLCCFQSSCWWCTICTGRSYILVEESTYVACNFHFCNCGCCGAYCNGMVQEWKMWTFWLRWLHNMGYIRRTILLRNSCQWRLLGSLEVYWDFRSVDGTRNGV
ncbi:PREDICTED: uncharacterized protein LOC101298788 [Fragaria vesca subsp. vesca]